MKGMLMTPNNVKATGKLTRLALKAWGVESQLDMVIEECAELIDAIQKWRRKRVDSLKVLEEGVDVELCVEQLKLILNAPALWENIKKDKLERLQKLLDQSKVASDTEAK